MRSETNHRMSVSLDRQHSIVVSWFKTMFALNLMFLNGSTQVGYYKLAEK